MHFQHSGGAGFLEMHVLALRQRSSAHSKKCKGKNETPHISLDHPLLLHSDEPK
jgi:hypothetical protein